ncbi:MAG: hypothetical protein ACJAZN_003540, partial [Planctomycetota bacterium]
GDSQGVYLPESLEASGLWVFWEPVLFWGPSSAS